MSRMTDFFLLTVAIGGAVWTYQIKHEAEQSAKQLNSLRAQISAQNRKIALLEADWALETSPSRLEKIAQRYTKQLQLRNMESSQIVDTSELPGLRVDRQTEGDETYARTEGGVVTGGIGELIERGGDN